MEELLHYLKLKNLYYEKFYSETLKFAKQANQGHWDDIEFFVDNRDRILGIIRYFDTKIARISQETQFTDEVVETNRPKIQELMKIRKELADKIVRLDLELTSRIDEYKTETIKELKKTQQTRDTLQSFSLGANPVVSKTKPIKEA